MTAPINVGYTTNIPNPPNFPSQDVANMQINTNSISTLLQVDHFGFGNNQGGSHARVQLAEVLGSSPPVGLLNGYETIYSQIINANGEIFFTRGSSGTGIQLTGPGTPVVSASGYTFLPGGILMQWGTNTCASGTTITFPVPFKVATTPFSIQCTIFQNTTNRHFVYARSSTNANFVTTQLDNGGVAETNTFSWIAIGQG